ncbi:hypothetical protein HPB49_013081 [Dermacentor silvarum]|uniref:Uncharacterized protein n=1 Tax=Dermacentor silvarum TaxID=543639 RepID=A0ACB8E0R2_DERSI|nr:hypothetical protein HPB49_013081 [Dermacentor silvarum]
MARHLNQRRSPTSNSAISTSITQWNYRGFKNRTKRANFRLYLETFESLPAVIALQEPGLGTALPNYTTFQQDPASCLLVHKAYTDNLVDLDLQLEYSYVMVTILPLRRRDPPLHVLNVYCSPKLKRVTFAYLFCRALRVTGRDPLLIVGDFNAPSQLWGYRREELRGPWSQHLLKHLHSHETQIQLSDAATDVDNHLLHLWEARRSLVRRWRRQKHNTKLKAPISELTQRAPEYAAQLADSNWVDRCNTAARQMSSRNTWRLFRALIDPTQTRTETQKHLQRAVHAFPGNTTQLAQKLRDQYLCTAQDSPIVGAPGSASAKQGHSVPTRNSGPVRTGCTPAAEAAMAVPEEASHPGMAGASLSSEVQHCYKRRSHVPPPPSALMPFAQEKRRSVAAMNANENNRCVSSRLAKLRRPLRAADKEPLQRKERIAKQVTSKLRNASSWDKEQQPTTCTVAAQGRSSPKFQQQLHPPSLPPTPSSKHRGTISAARIGPSGAGQGTVASMTTDNVPATTKDLEGQVVPVKVAALRALAQLLKRQPQHFHNYAELTLIKIFGAFKQPEESRAAELCSMEAAAALPPEQTMGLLHTLIGQSDDRHCNQGHVSARASASKKG